MKKFKKFWRTLGPGLVTGAADDDPSGIATYTQAGAMFGTGMLWTAALSLPFMTAIQEVSGRIGLVTGRGIAAIVGSHYSKTLLWFCIILLLCANTINITADIGAMAQSLQLALGGYQFIYVVAIAAISLTLQIHIPYKRYAGILKYLTLSLGGYIVVAFITTTNWGAVLQETIHPQLLLSREWFGAIIAILGTTISPYLFFWQADQEREEEIAHKTLSPKTGNAPVVTTSALTRMRIDTTAGMFASNIIMFFIIATAAATLKVSGITSVQTAADAAAALKPLSGTWASLLFTIGILGTGMLAIPVLAGSAAYAVSEAAGYKVGLYLKFKHARGFYSIIIAITAVAALFTLLPIAPFTLLYIAAIVNGIAAVPLMATMIAIANNKTIMGTHVSGFTSNVTTVTITLIMAACATALFVL